MGKFFEFFANCVEAKQLGLNFVTFTLLSTMIFALLRAYGLYMQYRKIYRYKSVKSISVMQYSFYFASFSSTLVYGLHIGSFAIVFNGVLLTVFHVPVLVGIVRYSKRSSKNVLLFLLYLSLVPAMWIAHDKNLLLSLILIASVVPLIDMNYKIYRAKSGREVEPIYLVMTTLSSSFWFSYGFIIKSYPIIIFNLVAGLLFILALSLKSYYNKKNPES